jgi:hypothetical protein
VPAHQTTSLLKDLVRRGAGRRSRGHEVNSLVVELEKGQLQLGDDHVLVVARVSDDRAILTCARQIACGFGVDEKLGLP